MMIRHDDIDTEGFRMSNRSDISSSTVDRDDEFHIFFCEFIEEILLQPISIMDTMGKSVGDETSDLCEEAYEDSGTRDSIDIIVSKYHDAFFFFSCFEDSRNCLLHIREEIGIMEIGEICFEKKSLIFWSDFPIFSEYLRERLLGIIEENYLVSSDCIHVF